MHVKFTYSIMQAFEAILRLFKGEFEHKGAIIPEWEYFTFFSEIQASPIKKSRYNEKMFKLERVVNLFHNGEKVAVVHLVGNDEEHQNRCWVVEKIEYYTPYYLPAAPYNHDWVIEEQEELRATGKWHTVEVVNRDQWLDDCANPVYS